MSQRTTNYDPMKKITLLTVALFISATSFAQLLQEGFDDITALEGDGWTLLNASTIVGATTWFQGSDTVFPAFIGASDSYIGANFNSTTGSNTISTWLITPVLNVENGDQISFYTRTIVGSPFADRLEVRISEAGAGSTEPTLPVGVGSYTNVLNSINPNLDVGFYPEGWTNYNVSITGLTGTGVRDVRIAFRYYVTAGGPAGTNSNYIGIDEVSVSSTLGTSDFEKNKFSYSYNKNIDRLKLKSSSIALESVEVFNILGQKVLNRALSSFEASIDLSAFNDGVYLVKVRAGGSSKTIKMLKQ